MWAFCRRALYIPRPHSAFIASGASERGQAVSSLGSTLAIKMLSATPVEDASRGVYRYDTPSYACYVLRLF